MVICVNTNPPLVSSLTVLEPNGEVASAIEGTFTVPNAARNYSGTYTCLINSTINNDLNVMATAEVTIRCKLTTFKSVHIAYTLKMLFPSLTMSDLISPFRVGCPYYDILCSRIINQHSTHMDGECICICHG